MLNHKSKQSFYSVVFQYVCILYGSVTPIDHLCMIIHCVNVFCETRGIPLPFLVHNIVFYASPNGNSSMLFKLRCTYSANKLSSIENYWKISPVFASIYKQKLDEIVVSSPTIIDPICLYISNRFHRMCNINVLSLCMKAADIYYSVLITITVMDCAQQRIVFRDTESINYDSRRHRRLPIRVHIGYYAIQVKLDPKQPENYSSKL